MSEPMTDERLKYAEAFLPERISGIEEHAVLREMFDEIRRLREENKRLTEERDDTGRLWTKVRKKNAKLRKVVDAVRDKMPGALSTLEREALRELDKEEK